METKLVVIGNSQGVRLPKAVVEEAGIALEQPLDIDVRNGAIVLTPAARPRSGWAEAVERAPSSAENLWGGLPLTLARDDWTW